MASKHWPSRPDYQLSLLDQMLDYAPVYLAYISKGLIIQYITKNFAAWYGLSKEELIGQHVKEIIPQKYKDLIWCNIKEVMDGKNVLFKSEVTDKENITYPILTQYIPDIGSNDEIAGFTVYIKQQPLTIKAGEESGYEQLRAINRAEELDRFFNLALDLLCIADTDGYFVKLNPEWERTLGYKIEDLNGKYFIDLVHPDDKAATYKALKDLKNKKSVYNFVNRYLCKDGTYKWIEWRSNTFGNRIYAAARDISQRIEYEKAIEESQALLKESNTTKDKLFSIIAHDLKGPFSAILGYTDYLKSGLYDSNTDDLEEIINNLYISSKSAFDLLENLLDWSRMQSGVFKFHSESVLLSEIIEPPVNTVQSIAKSKNIEIQTKYIDNINVLADLNLTNTILRNLLANAVKFSYQNSPVVVDAWPNNDMVYIRVTDYGIGIRPESLKNLFTPESSETTPGTLNEKGTGLGLMLCKDFIEKQGGYITVESEVSKGSSFIFTLPLYKK